MPHDATEAEMHEQLLQLKAMRLAERSLEVLGITDNRGLRMHI